MDKRTLYPVYKEIPADIETPVSAFFALQGKNGPCFLLESVEMGDKIGRYSFLGFEPALTFIATKDRVNITADGKTEVIEHCDPVRELEKLISSFDEKRPENLPPFSAGLVGYFSYDAVRYFEKLPDTKPDKLGLPDICLVLPKILVAFDHITQKMILIAYTYDEADKTGAEQLIKKYEEKLYRAKTPARIAASEGTKIQLTSNFKKENYLDAVEKAKKHIVAGDIFQVVLSQQFRIDTEVPPFDIYRKLRMINPSPYMYYIDLESFQIIGSSPEVMVKRTKTDSRDEILLRPIAGTRPRGRNAAEDLAAEKELLSDEKELAEHTMLLDLARNDIGKVSEYGSVKVENTFHIERYSHVMHMVSDVTAKPKEGATVTGMIGSAFPAGTVSGAPKIRAMEIIDELEPERRGVYAGAIGYIDFRGNFDTCIAIRTIVYRDGTAYLQAGAGIVYDSVPEKEYEETINKAKALMKALV
jgi:anthranilate synthase component 1